MIAEEKECIYLDGMRLKEEHLLKLALNVGNYPQAEHYLFALLAHGVIYGISEVIDKVNEVRKHYGVPEIPTPEKNVTNEYGRRHGDSVDDKARKAFMIMGIEERRNILKSSLSILRSECHLFKYNIHWLGVYLVIRDRLEGEQLKMRNFNSYANEIMPEDWPETLRMNKNTYKNFGKLISYEDKGEAYYDMAYNSQEELCDKFWEIVKQLIFTT